MNYAGQLMEQHRYPESIAWLEQVFKRNPDVALARTNLGIAYQNESSKAQSQDEALADIHKALLLDPNDTNARQGLNYILARSGMTELKAPEREKYAASLQQKGDLIGACAEYIVAAQEDPGAKGKIDELVSNEQRGRAPSLGGVGAVLLFDQIEIDHNKDASFNFEWLPYYRGVRQKVHAAWKAPAALGNRAAVVGFAVKSSGDITSPKLVTGCGDKAIDQMALNAVKAAAPFKPFSRAVAFDVPITLTMDSKSDESPTYYLNGVASPNGLKFSTGSELSPLRAPKDVDARLQAKSDAAMSQANKAEQDLAKVVQQSGLDSPKLCAKLRAVAALYLQANDYKTAEDRLTRAAAIAEKANDDSERAASLSQLGSLYYTINKPAEAESVLKQALDLMDKAASKDVGAQRRTMEAYAKVLYKLNRVEEGNQIYAKIRALPSSGK
jgi:TonB family protein